MTTSNNDEQRQMLREFEEHTMPLMPRLLAQARALTNSEQDAQDLVQETYLKAFRAWKQFELGTNLKAWLVKIMKNTNLNNLEKSNRDKTRGSIDELEDWQVGGAESLTARASRSAEAEAMENLPTSTVLKALDTLPAEFREVVLQAIVVGLPYAEIAANMGTPVGTVMSRLHRGKKALRVALAEYAREEGYLNENELETEQE
ncbi:MAG: sigma-70 family RNA polymerase sigma factor [Actinomycetales bacterium]|nr:sigma-70 family RNA polymerase sigma factor [Actinomycetales bacterium]